MSLRGRLACSAAALLATFAVAGCALHATRDDGACSPILGSRYDSTYVTMRDGVDLAVDVRRPRGCDGRGLPAILHPARWGRSLEPQLWMRPFLFRPYGWAEHELRGRAVRSGYVWVDADLRGTGASFGSRPYPFAPAEIRDGRELVEWIVRQPWSNGRVALVGSSQEGATVELMRADAHPAVEAAVLRFSPYDLYEDMLFPGGVRLEEFQRTWASLVRAVDGNDLDGHFGWWVNLLFRGIQPVDRELLRRAVAMHEQNVDVGPLLEGIEFRDDELHGTIVGSIDAVSPHSHTRRSDRARPPVYVAAGWYDMALARGAIRRHLDLPGDGHRLVIGPWRHGGRRAFRPYGEDVDFDQEGDILRFLNFHLKGVRNGVAADAPVRWFTMGEGRWKSAGRWPPPGLHRERWYLAGGNVLSPNAPGRVDAGAGDVHRVDPEVGTGWPSRWNVLVGEWRRSEYGAREETDGKLLGYTSPPLPEAVEITGHPVVHLFVTSTATDGALFVYLEDVSPGGEVRYVTEGQLRLIHREHRGFHPELPSVPLRTFRRADATPVVPGQPTRVVFALHPVSWKIPPGHRLRLTLTGADTDHFELLPEGTPPTLQIHRSQAFPSHLELPKRQGSPGSQESRRKKAGEGLPSPRGTASQRGLDPTLGT